MKKTEGRKSRDTVPLKEHDLWAMGLFCQSSPLILCFLVTICMRCLPIYFFLLWFPFLGNESQ
jgi:hypothetical protein